MDTGDSKTGRSRRLLHELLQTKTGLFISIMSLVALAALLLSSILLDGLWQRVLLSVGVGTLVSAMLTTAQTAITAPAAQRVLVDAVVSDTSERLQELSDQYRALSREFLPTHAFNSSAEPLEDFNRIMAEDVATSQQWFFRGLSGRHSAARILHDKQRQRELRLILADPKDMVALRARANYQLNGSDSSVDPDELYQRLVEQIEVGLVGLYLARNRCSNIDVTMIRDVMLDRFEIFDESVWVTLYSDSVGTGEAFPRTFRFARRSFLYSMTKSDFLRISNSRAFTHFAINSETEEEEFINIFETATGRRIDSAQLAEKKKDFENFCADFLRKAVLRG